MVRKISHLRRSKFVAWLDMFRPTDLRPLASAFAWVNRHSPHVNLRKELLIIIYLACINFNLNLLNLKK